jgi:2-oxo-4-hydroxy-4-carboxy-5-ureidoimidazoline decarboxylase
MTRDKFTSALGWIFEDSPWVASQAWQKRPFPSREELHRAMVNEVESAGHTKQLALLQAHPDLGARAQLSAASAGEQAGVGLDRLAPEQFEIFTELNRAYRDKFGIPFLYAVRGSTKQDILNALLIRVDSSPEEEFRQALWEVYRIAWFRIESAIAP